MDMRSRTPAPPAHEVPLPRPLGPLSLGELLDRSLSIYKSHFLVFAGIAALPSLFSGAMNAALMAMPLKPAGSPDVFSAFLRTLGLLVVEVAVLAIAYGATAEAVAAVFRGQPPSIRAALSALHARTMDVLLIALAMTGMMFAVGLAAMVPFVIVIAIVLSVVGIAALASPGMLIPMGMAMLIVGALPGIAVASRWAVAIPIVAVERRRIGDAMARSRRLMEGLRWRVFVIPVFWLVLGMVRSQLTLWLLRLLNGGGPLTLASASVRLALFPADFALNSLTIPLLTIALSLVYIDARVRKEAFDIDRMIAEIDRTAAPAEGHL